MKQESSPLAEKKILNSNVISFNKISHQSRLFLDYQADAQNLDKFYPEKQTDVKVFAEKVLANYKIERRLLCDVLTETNKEIGASEATLKNIELLRQADAVAIVTGQQAGLFSGALYTVYKALTAVKIAGDLRGQNIKAVPVFWIAEEDHDFDEIKKTFVLDKKTNLTKIENTPENYKENSPVGFIELDETINGTIGSLLENLPHTEFTASVKNLLSQTYKPGKTFAAAFAKIMAKIFAEYGIVFLSPLDEKLKKLCAPIFVEAIDKTDEIVSALRNRNSELENENYQPQVLVAANSFPFFFQNENGQRLSVKRDSESLKFKVQNSKIEFSKTELLKTAASEPQKLSPNALMRPVVQDYLLPTLLYVGGAAEIAYFAQNSVIYKTLNRPVTPIRHRASLTVVRRSHARTLKKYELPFSVLFESVGEIYKKAAEEKLNPETARIFDEVEGKINEQLNRLDKSLVETDLTLGASLAMRRKKIVWHIAALRKKFHRAEIEKDGIIQRQIENLFTELMPNKALQERTLNVTTFINLYGMNFIDWIYQEIKIDERGHQILYL